MPPAGAMTAAALLLVCGDDDYTVKHRARQLYAEWCREVGGLDHETIDGQAANSTEALNALARLREALQTLPFFGTGKVIWLKDCNFLGDDRTAEAKDVTNTLTELADEMKRLNWDQVRLLISAGKVDKRRAFFKAIEKLGTVEVYEALTIQDKDWENRTKSAAARLLRAHRKTVTPEALHELVNTVGPDLHQLQNEAEKLALFVGDRPTVEVADVRAVVSRNPQARAFALADALGERDLPKVLACLEAEVATMPFDKEKNEVGLLYGLINKVRSLILVKEILREEWIKLPLPGDPRRAYADFKTQLDRIPRERLPEDRRYSPAGVHAYVLFNSLRHAQNYTLEELVAAMELLLECNRRLFSSALDPKLILEQTLVRIVRGEQAGGSRPPTEPVGAAPTVARN